MVEQELGLTEGFWGLVDRGLEVGLVDNQATLMRDGSPLAGSAGTDLTGLLEAEAVVARLGGPPEPATPSEASDLPAAATPEAAGAIRRRLSDLAARWRQLGDGEALTLTFR